MRVRSAPQGGEANEALCALLAERLDIPASSARVVAGAKSQLEQVAVSGDPAALVGRLLSASHLLAITLPPWLLAICYALVGWSIGLRFTRGIVLHAAKQLPKIFASIFTLIAMCGGLGFALHEAAGTDPLTAYLATSPGGADAVAIIAASSPVEALAASH